MLFQSWNKLLFNDRWWWLIGGPRASSSANLGEQIHTLIIQAIKKDGHEQIYPLLISIDMFQLHYWIIYDKINLFV